MNLVLHCALEYCHQVASHTTKLRDDEMLASTQNEPVLEADFLQRLADVSQLNMRLDHVGDLNSPIRWFQLYLVYSNSKY